MIDHVTLPVSNLARSRVFYEQLFAPLKYTVCFGKKHSFWAFDIGDGLFEITQAEEGTSVMPVHVAFRVPTKDSVQAFHAAGLAAEGKDNGKPGPRPAYTPTYYAAFILDPDGHNIEAMYDV